MVRCQLVTVTPRRRERYGNHQLQLPDLLPEKERYMKAMVIDDSRAMRTILMQMLSEIGFDVSGAGDGKEALKLLEDCKECPDVALVDWYMPEMSGLDFVKKVREQSDFDKLQLMMVTSESEMARVVEALEAGANEFVMKPFTKDVVKEKLEILGIHAE